MKNKKTFCLFAVCLMLLTILLVNKTFQNDIFFTIPTGNYIMENGVNDVEPFTWHQNLKFTKLRWAFDVCVAGIYNIFGFTGLYIFTLVIAELIALTLFTTISKKGGNKIVAFAVTLFAMVTLSSYITCRAQIVSYLLFALEMYSIQKLMETGQKRYSVYLIAISYLILCFHSSVWLAYFFFYIPYIVECIIVKLEINKLLEKPDKIIIENRNFKPLFITMIIALLCGFCTPLGLSPFTYMPKVLGGVSSEIILELKPTVFEKNTSIVVLIISLFVMLGTTKTKVKLVDLFYILGFLLMSKLALRNVGIAIVAMSIPFANIINSMIEEYDKKSIFEFAERKLGKITSMILIFLIVVLIVVTHYKEIQNQKYYTSAEYPIAAAEFIKENLDLDKIKIYNQFNYGSYLEFCGIPTFIDSRSEIYCKEFNDVTILEDFKLLEINKSVSIDYIVEKYGITHIVEFSSADCVEHLRDSEKYKEIYGDFYFVVYEVVGEK